MKFKEILQMLITWSLVRIQHLNLSLNPLNTKLQVLFRNTLSLEKITLVT